MEINLDLLKKEREVHMTIKAKKIFLCVSTLSALVCACLGLETRHSNPLGWALLLGGTGFTSLGCLALGGLFLSQGESQPPADRSLWLPCLGALLISLVTPLEFLYLPEVLPRNAFFQDLGLILAAGGLAFFLLAARSGRPWGTQSDRHWMQRGTFGAALRRVALCPISAGLLLFLLALGIGFSSLIGLALTLLVEVPGLFLRMRGV
jgi:hypothetical protein